MKKAEIKIGGLYEARVDGKHTTVRVEDIRDKGGISGTHFTVTNLTTGRRTTFHSAAKFRSEVRNETNINQWSVVDSTEPVLDLDGSGLDATRVAFDNAMVRNAELAPLVDEEEEMRNDPLGKLLTAALAPENDDVEGEHSSDPIVGAQVAAVASMEQSSECAVTVNKGFAAKIVAAQSKRLSCIPDTVAGYTPTDEQRAILEAVLEILNEDGPKVLVINAGAGTGKTSTLRMLEEVLYGQIQYTAYNRPLVDESKTKFRKAKCSTSHGLAFAPVGVDYKHRLNGSRVRSWAIAQHLGVQDYSITGEPYPKGSPEWTEAANAAGYNDTDNLPPDDFSPAPVKVLKAAHLAGLVSQALKKFSQTVDQELVAKHFTYIDGVDAVDEETGRRGRDNNIHIVEYLLPFARKFWNDVCDVNGQLPFQHDYYVKMWQLSRTAIIPADHILLDEHQDTAPVFADIIRRQSATVVLVGDENQRIYEWRGAMNAADLFPDAPVLFLSQSFRFGQTVADVANSVLRDLDEPTKLDMKGLPSIPTRVLLDLPTDEFGNPVADDREDEYVGNVCYLYRTNAGALARILRKYADGKRGCLVGKVDEIVKFVRAAQELQSGNRTTHPELAAFENWKEVQEYVEEDPDGGDLKLMVKLVDEFKCGPIIEALNNMPEEKDADFVCSTSHKSKGREWDTVVLGADFPPAHKMQDSDRRLLYVACTRAKLVLDLTACTPFHEYKDKDGNKYPCVEVDFTVDMPTQQELLAYKIAKLAAEIAAPKMALPASQSASGPIPDLSAPSPPVAATAPANGSGYSRRPAIGFTWTNFDNKWCARGPIGAELGKRVKVVRKNGTSSEETLKKVVRTFDDACVYEV